MNISMISGRLTNDPMTRKVTVGGQEVTVTNFTVAVHDSFKKDENGNYADTTFIRVNAWRGLGDTAAKHLTKGRQVAVRGPIKLNTYIDSHNAARSGIELRAEWIEMLDSKKVEATEEAPAEVEADAELPFDA